MRFDHRFRALLVLGMLGCSRHPASCVAGQVFSPPAPAASAEVEKILETDLEDDAGDDAGQSFVELVRRDAWDEAFTVLQALPEEKKRKPTVRLVTARVAMARGDYETARDALVGLEKELTPIADDIERWTAEAEAHVGPFEPAARYFAKQSSLKNLARAAMAFDKAGLSAEAGSAANRAIALSGQGKGDAAEVPVRALRARLAEAAGQNANAADDLRFIVLKAPASDEAKLAMAALARLDPSRPLTGKERLTRAERLVDAGRTDEAISELELARKALAPPSDDELRWVHASALYQSRGRYEAAAAEYTKFASKRGPRQAEALFLAARALSRADRDDDAARGYSAVARRFPESSWADEATYLAARLHFLHGSWSEAAVAYAGYLQRFSNGKQKNDAAYERTLALLADGQYTLARTELHRLVQAQSSSSEAARLRELEGLAAAKAGDKDGASALFQEVIRSQPLSWAASAARARLIQQGAEGLTLIDPSDGKGSEPLSYKLPPVADLYHRLGLDGDAEGYLKAHEKEAVSSLLGREKEGLCAMYGDLGRAARSYRIAVDAVPAAVLSRAPSKGSEWAWRCLYPRPYFDRVQDLEAREALPPGLIYSVMRQESPAYNPDALSGARAVGLLQLMPDTARHVAEEAKTAYDEKLLRTPPVNLDLGLAISPRCCAPSTAASHGRRGLQRRAARGTALARATQGAQARSLGRHDPVEETRTYVNKVMSNWARYAFLAGGDAAVPQVSLSLPTRAPAAPTVAPKEEAAEY